MKIIWNYWFQCKKQSLFVYKARTLFESPENINTMSIANEWASCRRDESKNRLLYVKMCKTSFFPVAIKLSSIFVRSRVMSSDDEKRKQTSSVMISIHLLKGNLWELSKQEFSLNRQKLAHTSQWKIEAFQKQNFGHEERSLTFKALTLQRDNKKQVRKLESFFKLSPLSSLISHENHWVREFYSLAFSYQCKHIQLVMKIAMNFPESGLFSSCFRTNQQHKYFMLATVIDCFNKFLHCEWNNLKVKKYKNSFENK